MFDVMEKLPLPPWWMIQCAALDLPHGGGGKHLASHLLHLRVYFPLLQCERGKPTDVCQCGKCCIHLLDLTARHVG